MNVKRNPTREFRPGVAEKLAYYVYRFVDPRFQDGVGRNRTFYVGKGKGNRAFSHLWDAEAALNRPREKRSGKENRIIEIWESGNDVSIVIHRHGLLESDALLVESALIDMLPGVETDPEYRTNRQRGHHANELGMKLVDDVNHQYAARKAEFSEPMALIKINRRWGDYLASNGVTPHTDEIYEMTRCCWKINPDRHKEVRYAAAVAFGLIREVFNIEEWTSPDANRRRGFLGHPSQEHRYLVGTFVGHIFPVGAQTPVRWFYPKKRSSRASVD